MDEYECRNRESCVGFVIAIVLLVIIVVVVLFFFFNQRVQLIDPEKCPKVSADYAVLPSTSSEILMSCGPLSNEECTFEDVTLSEAVSKCNSMRSKCSEFSFDCKNSRMSITIPSSNKESSDSRDLYILQR